MVPGDNCSEIQMMIFSLSKYMEEMDYFLHIMPSLEYSPLMYKLARLPGLQDDRVLFLVDFFHFSLQVKVGIMKKIFNILFLPCAFG